MTACLCGESGSSGTKTTALGAVYRVFCRRVGVSTVFVLVLVLLSAAPVLAQVAPAEVLRAVPRGEVQQFSWRMVLLLSGYSAAIVLASLLGGWLSSLVHLTHTVSQTIISFVGGLMLGIGVFHLLPHSLHGGQTASDAAGWMMCGIVAMFLLIRWFHFHHHGPLEISTDREDPCAGQHTGQLAESPLVQLGSGAAVCDHSGEHVHGDHGSHVHSAAPAGAPHCHHAHQLSWVGILIGLALHTLLDGMALAASVAAESRHSVMFSLFGFGTFLAVLLHKPMDALSITALMKSGGWDARQRFRVNLGFALMCPLGALLFVLGLTATGGAVSSAVSGMLAFSAGVFICIALSDLLPEMEFHAHNRLQLTTVLLGGILLAWCLRFLESGQMHQLR